MNDDNDSLSSDEEFLTTSADAAHTTAGGSSGHGNRHNRRSSSNSTTKNKHAAPQQDREALVRKKLLENFYGKSAVAAATPTKTAADGSAETDSDDDDDSDDDEDEDDDKSKRRGTTPSSRNDNDNHKDDLDSPEFDAVGHTAQHVMNHGVHELLQHEEQLALQVRTLDSTMQTLVYENYTRFIDATDAIKSIGVHVKQHETDLLRLTTAIAAVDETSRSVEDSVGAIRDQVAEKIRTARLLSRLDALLQLPTTLQQLQRDGKYPAAVAAFYPQAANILAKHASFESLKTIETECRDILQEMQAQLQHKLVHWSGVDVVGLVRLGEDGAGGGMVAGTANRDDDDEEEEDSLARGAAAEDDDYNDHDDAVDDAPGGNVPDPPKTMTEIFECVSALLLLWQHEQQQQQQHQHSAAAGASGPIQEEEEEEEEKNEQQQQQFSVRDLQSMASAAALRFLDRTLDAHVIQVQERRFGGGGSAAAGVGGMDMGLGSASGGVDPLAPSGSGELASAGAAEPGAALVASEFLTALLQGATLFADTFASAATGTTAVGDHHHLDNDDSSHYQYWMELIQEAFASFLVHTRSILLEESAQLQQQQQQEQQGDVGAAASTADDLGGNATTTAAGGGSSSAAATGGYAEISAALGLLVRQVQQIAAGLEQIGAKTQSGGQQSSLQLVAQVQALTKSMVRRRVDQKFHALRLAIVQDCLVPFVQEQAAAQALTTTAALKQEATTRVVSSTLSNCLQLVDDTIRSILAGDLAMAGSSNNPNATTSGGDGSGDLSSSTTPHAAAVPDLKDAVQASTKKFAYWLANALELLAGGECSDRIAEAPLVMESTDDHHHDEHRDAMAPTTSSSSRRRFENDSNDRDDLSDMMMPGESDDEMIWDKLDAAVAVIAAAAAASDSNDNTDDDDGAQYTDFVLAICEMCRMAQSSVAVNLEQSIASHLGGSKKKSRGLFPSGAGVGSGAAAGGGGEASTSTRVSSLGQQQPSPQENDISKRFELAESRVLVLYAGYRGSQAANLLCLGLTRLSALSSDDEELDHQRPTDQIVQALGIAKQAAIEIASVYGGNKRAGPVAPVEDGGRSLLAPGLTTSSSLVLAGGRKTALQLDVERMFKEKVSIYPHPSQVVEVSRNATVFLLLKIAFRAMFEQARLLRFSVAAFRQLQLDTELLKHMTLHYIDEGYHPAAAGGGGSTTEVSTTLANLLDDVVDVVGERCEDDDDGTIMERRDEWVGTALHHLRSFLDTESDSNKSFIIEED